MLHQAHGLLAEHVGMVDGRDAGLRGVERARLVGGVHGDAGAHAGGLSDSGRQLRGRVLVRGDVLTVDFAVGAGLVDLDKVGALLELQPDGRDELIGVVGVSRVGGDVFGGVEVDRVLVAAEDADRIARDTHARPRDQAVVDSVAHGGISRACAFGAHVALGGKAGHQVGARGEGGQDGAFRD